MIIKNFRIIIIFLFPFFSLFSQQEYLTGLDYNFKTINNNQRLKSLKTDFKPLKIPLPLVDDFSQNSEVLDTSYWISDNVTVNNNLARHMVSLGVVTFDAIGANGRLPDSIDFNSTNRGDILESKILEIKTTDKNVFLSFLYQPGGYADPPEENDSLILQFYDYVNLGWKTVWKAQNLLSDSSVMEITGSDTTYWNPEPYYDSSDVSHIIKINGTLANFKTVILPIEDYNYIDSLLRFRFVNYFTAKLDDYLGKISNCDYWHIDYVKVAANRSITDSVIKDLAFVGTINNVLKDYYSIPARHMNSDLANNQWTDLPKVKVKNNYDSIINYSRTIILEDLINDVKIIKANNNSNIRNFELQNVSDGLSAAQNDMKDFLVDAPGADTGRFKFTYVIEALSGNNSSELKQNDTISKIVEFASEYAYDDGSPENGYGIIGNNTKNAKVAVFFEPFIEDTLRGVYIFFNDVYSGVYDDIGNSFEAPYFKLTVWNQKGNLPGDTLYSRSVKTYYQNKSLYYKLEKPLFIDHPIYIGWIQIKEEYLNVGFDLSKDNSAKNFINIQNSWVKSSMKGTIMIRPVFGAKDHNPPKEHTNIHERNESILINVYPNPVTDILYLENNYENTAIEYMISDMQGRIIERNYTDNGQINCSHLQKGVYIFTFWVNNLIAHKKIIVDRSY